MCVSRCCRFLVHFVRSLLCVFDWSKFISDHFFMRYVQRNINTSKLFRTKCWIHCACMHSLPLSVRLLKVLKCQRKNENPIVVCGMVGGFPKWVASAKVLSITHTFFFFICIHCCYLMRYFLHRIELILLQSFWLYGGFVFRPMISIENSSIDRSDSQCDLRKRIRCFDSLVWMVNVLPLCRSVCVSASFCIHS